MTVDEHGRVETSLLDRPVDGGEDRKGYEGPEDFRARKEREWEDERRLNTERYEAAKGRIFGFYRDYQGLYDVLLQSRTNGDKEGVQFSNRFK